MGGFKRSRSPCSHSSDLNGLRAALHAVYVGDTFITPRATVCRRAVVPKIRILPDIELVKVGRLAVHFKINRGRWHIRRIIGNQHRWRKNLVVVKVLLIRRRRNFPEGIVPGVIDHNSYGADIRSIRRLGIFRCQHQDVRRTDLHAAS